MYELGTSPEDVANAYIQRLQNAADIARLISPRATIDDSKNDEFKFIFHAVGDTKNYEITVRVFAKDKLLIVEATPAFPMYALAVAGAFLIVNLVPSYFEKDEDTIRIALSRYEDVAVQELIKKLASDTLLEPSFFTDYAVSFEGLLCDTYSGKVAFTGDLPMDCDPDEMIVEHQEENAEADNIMSVDEYLVLLAMKNIQNIRQEDSES